MVYAATFDADKIASYIETPNRFCELVTSQPGLGKQDHGYDTMLYGVVRDANWIFFQYDAAEA